MSAIAPGLDHLRQWIGREREDERIDAWCRLAEGGVSMRASALLAP